MRAAWPFKGEAHLFGRRLLGASVFVSESPVERGDVEAAAGLCHEILPGLEDGGVSGAGIELQSIGDALHQNNPDRGEERKCVPDDEHRCSSFALWSLYWLVLA